jgi:hypothetical protein
MTKKELTAEINALTSRYLGFSTTLGGVGSKSVAQLEEKRAKLARAVELNEQAAPLYDNDPQKHMLLNEAYKLWATI